MVALALLALLALSAFVFDYGVMWSSRRQAQNSADAGALAGAISLAFDSPTDQAAARARAIAMATENQVWGQAPSVTDGDVTFPVCPPGTPGPTDTCVKVDVFRNQARGNALPTFFAHLVDITSQGVVATATAQVVPGSTTNCLRPWAVVDRWQEFGPEGPVPTPISTFDRYSTGQGNNPPQENDVYIPPLQRRRHRLPAASRLRTAVRDQGRAYGRQRDFVWLVPDDRPAASRYDAAGQQHRSEQHPDLQRPAFELRGPDDGLPDEHRQYLGGDGVLGGTRLLPRPDWRDGWLDTQHGRGAHGAGWRGTLGRMAKASPAARSTRRPPVLASCQSA